MMQLEILSQLRYADSAGGSDFFSEHFLVLLSIIVVFLFSNFFLQLWREET